jgi:hypothetical protein
MARASERSHHSVIKAINAKRTDVAIGVAGQDQVGGNSAQDQVGGNSAQDRPQRVAVRHSVEK